MPTTPLKSNRNSGFQVTASCAHSGNTGLIFNISMLPKSLAKGIEIDQVWDHGDRFEHANAPDLAWLSA